MSCMGYPLKFLDQAVRHAARPAHGIDAVGLHKLQADPLFAVGPEQLQAHHAAHADVFIGVFVWDVHLDRSAFVPNGGDRRGHIQVDHVARRDIVALLPDEGMFLVFVDGGLDVIILRVRGDEPVSGSEQGAGALALLLGERIAHIQQRENVFRRHSAVQQDRDTALPVHMVRRKEALVHAKGSGQDGAAFDIQDVHMPAAR